MSILYQAPLKLNYRVLSNIAKKFPFTDAGDHRYLCFLLSCKGMAQLLGYKTEHYNHRLSERKLREKPSWLTLNPKEQLLYSVDRILYTFFLHASDLPNYYVASKGWYPSPYELIAGVKCPKVEFAADFTNWKPIETYYVEPDLLSRYDRFFYSDQDLWPAFCVDFILPPGEFQYKFIVDGVWTNTKQAPLIFDGDHNLNNYIDTTRHRWNKGSIDQETRTKGWNLVSVESSFFNGHKCGLDEDHYDERYNWLTEL